MKPKEPQRWEKTKALFDKALEVPVEGRDAFLAKACGGDDELQVELRSLLTELDCGDDLLETPLLDLRAAAMAERSPRLAVGALLTQRFCICRFIARGGMGEVYEAEDLELGVRVALKTIRPDIAGDERTLKLFKQEIQVARRVTHPNVCRIFDLGQHSEASADGSVRTVHFLTMESLEGEMLSEHLRAHGPFSREEALPLIEQMAAGLEAAHAAGVIHRDFKPANVILVSQEAGRPFRAVVTDFGVAVPVHPDVGEGPPRNCLAGTPQYMAPEQFENGPVTVAADVYSMGLVIAEMVGGEIDQAEDPADDKQVGPPKLEECVSFQLPASSESWRPVLIRCVTRSPEKRFSGPRQVVDALRTLEQADSKPHRWRILAAAAAILAIPLILQPLLPDRFQISSFIERFLQAKTKAGEVLSFQNRDWVLVTKLDNRTGEASLDGTMEYILARDLGNSRFVNVVSSDRVLDALALMRLPPDTAVDLAVGREICQRDGAIRAMLAGRIDSVGGVYELSLEVIDPKTGGVVDSRHEDAVGPAGLLAALGNLSSWARESLGESLDEIDSSRQPLEKVTTRSLSALKSYTLADATYRTGGDVEPLLREALAADPSFASAENLLAWVLRNAGRPEEEFLPHALRAKELSVNCSPRERLFIEASYYGHSGDQERSQAAYETLLRAFPDHFWAANNLAIYHLNRLQQAQALPYLLRASDLRPNLSDFNLLSALLLLQLNGDVRQAAGYASRVPEGNVAAVWDGWKEWALVFPVHQAWVEGNIEEARRELLLLANGLPKREGAERHSVATYAGLGFLMLGEFNRAEQCFQDLPPNEPEGTPAWEPIIAALAKEDPDELRRQLDLNIKTGHRISLQGREDTILEFTELQLMLLARAGFAGQVGQVLRSDEKRFSSPSWRFVRGEIAMTKGDLVNASSDFGEAIRYRVSVPWHESSYFDAYFLGVVSLAQALATQGKIPEAIRILEEASNMKARTSFPGTLTWGLNWLNIRSRLAELYRKMGRIQDARQVEDELLSHLAFADPRHPILLRIQEARLVDGN